MPSEKFAAYDIGSNSVKLKIARVSQVDGRPRLHPAASVRTVTRLGDGVYSDRHEITSSSMKATSAALEEMAALCKRHKIAKWRAIATSAVRDADNAAKFAAKARTILGVPIEIIPGPKEADLVHLGVHAWWPQLRSQKTLTLDLGGGSGQLICGRMNRVIARVSRPVGALRLTRQFLRHDPPRRSELRRMSEYIDDKITPVAGQLSADNVPYLIGTASSVAALVCHLRLVERWRRSAADGQSVTLGEVEGFLRKLAVMDLRRRRRLIGIGRRRAEIIIAGVAVIQRVMIACQLDELRYCTASVADGIIAHFATAAGKGVGAKEELHNVFLSYNSQDKPAVRRIARQLEDQGIVPFFDERDILPGKLWRSKVLQTVKAIPAAAVFIGPHGVGESQRDEIDALLEAAASFDRPIVPVLLPGADVSQIPSTLRERARVNFNNRGASPLRQLVSGVIPLE